MRSKCIQFCYQPLFSVAVLSLCLLLFSPSRVYAYHPLAVCDFDNDGFGDVVVGSASEDFKVGNAYAGRVFIFYGEPNGARESDEEWHQDQPGIGSSAEFVDHLGTENVCGDFNGDGYDDLALGVPDEDVLDVEDAGAVNIIYGSPTGLTAEGSQIWTQGSKGSGALSGLPEEQDYFGRAVAAGDFNSDGFDDLAVGAPGQGSLAKNSGIVHILFGSARGLTAENNAWMRGMTVFPSIPSLQGNMFGSDLTTGDFDGDGYDDLVVSAPNQEVDGVERAGTVTVAYGFSGGLHGVGDSISGRTILHKGHGGALTSGDFNGDGFDDLAIGDPGEKIMYATRQNNADGSTSYVGHTIESAGSVSVILGSSDGLTSIGISKTWVQGAEGLGSEPEVGDQFGAAISTGDFDGDGYDDLLIGVPGEDHFQTVDAGSFHVIYGSGSGLVARGTPIWTQDTTNVAGRLSERSRFGSALATGDLNGDGRDDAVVGVWLQCKHVEDRSELEGGTPGFISLLGNSIGLDGSGSWQSAAPDIGYNNCVASMNQPAPPPTPPRTRPQPQPAPPQPTTETRSYTFAKQGPAAGGIIYYYGQIRASGTLKTITNKKINTFGAGWTVLIPKPGNSTNDCNRSDKVTMVPPGGSTSAYAGIPLAAGYLFGFCLTSPDPWTLATGWPAMWTLDIAYTK